LSKQIWLIPLVDDATPPTQRKKKEKPCGAGGGNEKGEMKGQKGAI
jgi:hypothetical protein